MPDGPCFNQLWSEILLTNVTPLRCDNRVKKSCREYYLIEPGTVFRDVPITLSRAMLVGIDEEAGQILMPFRKPCHGTSLYVIDADREEIAGLRSDLIAAPVRRKKAANRRRSPGNTHPQNRT